MTVPLDKSYKNTLYFADEAAQIAYFEGKAKFSEADLYYQRKDNTIKFPRQYDEIMTCNYVMYKNTAYSNKWFYAFITKMEYLNDGVTLITIETDVIQTWMWDYHVLASFVEREHVDDDTIGSNTVPEGLETGEYVCDGLSTNTELQDLSIVIGVTLDINDYTNQAGDWNTSKEFKPSYGEIYNGIYSGIKYFAITPDNLKTILKYLAYEGQEDAVHCLFMAPTSCLNLAPSSGAYAREVLYSADPKNKNWECATKPATLNSYLPRNNKLLTYPYCYLMVDNGGGGAVNYHYEKFDKDAIKFLIKSATTPGMSIRAIPYGYNGLSQNDSEGINLSKYSMCSWSTDAYTSWLAKNGVNVAITTGAGIVSTALGIAGAVAAPVTGGSSLAVAGAVIGGVGAVSSQVASVAQHAQTPPQLHGNINNGDVATASKNVTFKAYQMSIRKEYAQIIDNYFDMYGYKVNRVKIPNSNHRENWWYTKTIDANIEGNVPQADLEKIKDCYNNGITFWRSALTMGMCGLLDNKITKGG
jgi:hypothetical protein